MTATGASLQLPIFALETKDFLNYALAITAEGGSLSIAQHHFVIISAAKDIFLPIFTITWTQTSKSKREGNTVSD